MYILGGRVYARNNNDIVFKAKGTKEARKIFNHFCVPTENVEMTVALHKATPRDYDAGEKLEEKVIGPWGEINKRQEGG